MNSLPPKPIRLLFYLPNLKSYKDRALLIQKVAKKTEKTILVVSRIDIALKESGLDDLDIRELPKKRIIGDVFFRSYSFVKEIIHKEKINIVHDTFGHLIFLFFRKNKFPNLVFIRSLYILAKWDFIHFHWPRYGFFGVLMHRDLQNWVFRMITQRFSSFYADHVIVQAPGLIPRLEGSHRFCKGKISWLPNSVPVEENQSSQKQNDTIQILYIGGFSIGKGCDILLELILKARRRFLNLKLIAIGGMAAVDHDYFVSKIEKFSLEPYITFLPKVDSEELGVYYRESDWLFHVSLLDGSPRVVLEALSMGLPVIGSTHPGIEIFDPKHEFILFTDSFSLDPVLDEIELSHENKERYKARAQKGVDVIREQFSLKPVSELYLDFYKKILQGKGQ